MQYFIEETYGISIKFCGIDEEPSLISVGDPGVN